MKDKNPKKQVQTPLSYFDFYPEMKPIITAAKEVVLGYEDYLREKIDHIDLAKKVLELRKHLDMSTQGSILAEDLEEDEE